MLQLIQWVIRDIDELLVGLLEPRVYPESRYFVDIMTDPIGVSMHSPRDFYLIEMLQLI